MTASRSPLVVINIVGLTPGMLGAATPSLNALIAEGCMTPLKAVFPAVTTSAQTTMLTGVSPREHGIVANGWYWRDLAEVRFWSQSSQLVQKPRVWDTLKSRDSSFTCSNHFWWFNMYANVDASITPRPHYPADGRKIIDLYSTPAGLHQDIERQIGKFPFFSFWGPGSDIRSSQWIADAAGIEFETNRPDLQLVYLPHLDYNLQRLGPGDPRIISDIQAIDAVAGQLIQKVRSLDSEVMVVSEYGMSRVNQDIPVNRILREHGYIAWRDSLDWEMLDPGACRAFAVCDHQLAHIYVRNPGDLEAVRELLLSVPGIEQVLCGEQLSEWGMDHPRSGDLIAIADADKWFSYYYWQDDLKAPDFARTVDIHRKPGYDPLELFIDPGIRFPKLKVAKRLMQKYFGQRMLMDVIPVRPTSLVKGSHGRTDTSVNDGPVFISSHPGLAKEHYQMSDIHTLILQHFGSQHNV